MAAAQLTLLDLPWLPRVTPDFRGRLRAVEEAAAMNKSDWGRAVRALASQAIGLNQAISLAQSISKLQAQTPSKALSPFRLGLVSNATTDFIKPFLVASAARYGVVLEIIAADFDQGLQSALDPQSEINRARPDAVLIAIDHRGLPFRNADAAEWPLFDCGRALDALNSMRAGFRRNSGALCLVQSLASPAELLFGSLDAAVAGTMRSAIAEFNSQLIKSIAASGDVLVDVEYLAQQVGLDQWYEDRQWHFARLPFTQRALPLYGDFVARLIAALRGKARKCLILDLDNTLWGGVIGDDGIEGIALNPGDPRGEAHRAIQQMASDLRRRGIVLAVCSKNDDAIARAAFNNHPGMILRETDIAVFSANWEDKATNIERIAQQLELGLDAMVFLDDNPVEREQVRQALPEVAVPEVGTDPSTYPRWLAAAGYFESIAFTREDAARADQYKSNAERAQLLEGARDLDEFLASLKMHIAFAPFDATGRKRITQLINKTNQFNVTTRRYTEQEVAALEASPNHYALQISVKDRFGDNGMISVIICNRGGENWDIDTWLMSCRVLNRKIEHAVCNQIVAAAKHAGAKTLTGTIIATERNGIVRDLYQRLGFIRSPLAQDQWTLDLGRFVPFTIAATESIVSSSS